MAKSALAHTVHPPRRSFARHLARNVGWAASLLVGSLLLGVLGYHHIAGLPWIDAVLDASMLLGGMGPVSTLKTSAGKLFAAGFALYSGVVFLIMAGMLLQPVAHRFMHSFHMEVEEARSTRKDGSQ